MNGDMTTQDPKLLEAAAREAEALGNYALAMLLRERAELIRRQRPQPVAA